MLADDISFINSSLHLKHLKLIEHGSRVLCHFSCGAPSAVATKIASEVYGLDNIEIVYLHIIDEHEDNMRFLRDCENWIGKKINIVMNEKYEGSVDTVIRKRKFIKSPAGACCTMQLKREMRRKIQRDDDIHVFGFTTGEEDRAYDFDDRNPALETSWILIESGLSRNDCLGILANQGIEIPTMYKLGYNNNNCIGCVKGGMGYWNKIREDFPQKFKERALLEREVGYSILKDKNGPLYLDELEPGRGRMSEEPDIECSLICTGVLDRLEAAKEFRERIPLIEDTLGPYRIK